MRSEFQSLKFRSRLSSGAARDDVIVLQVPRGFGAFSLRWRHNGCDSVSNHQPHHCLLNRLFRRRSKKTSKLRVTGLCAGNSPETGEFPAQMASNATKVSIWWRHHVYEILRQYVLLDTETAPLWNRQSMDEMVAISQITISRAFS